MWKQLCACNLLLHACCIWLCNCHVTFWWMLIVFLIQAFKAVLTFNFLRHFFMNICLYLLFLKYFDLFKKKWIIITHKYCRKLREALIRAILMLNIILNSLKLETFTDDDLTDLGIKEIIKDEENIDIDFQLLLKLLHNLTNIIYCIIPFVNLTINHFQIR